MNRYFMRSPFYVSNLIFVELVILTISIARSDEVASQSTAQTWTSPESYPIRATKRADRALA